MLRYVTLLARGCSAARATTWAVILICLSVRPAMACPVCFSAVNKHVLETYYFTAVLMTLLPLFILGSIGGWLYVRFTRSTLPGASPTCVDGGAKESRT